MGNVCPCGAGVGELAKVVQGKFSANSIRSVANNKGKRPQDLYDIERDPCGTGAFGTVRKAKNKKTKQVVAIKTMDSKKVPDMTVLQREIDINMSLDHPNIVRMFDTFQDAKMVYIAMEVCDGGEMFDIIVDQGSLTDLESVVLMEQIFLAMNYLHTHNVAHRDLKPENFLLSKKSSTADKKRGVPLVDNTLKVIDFGIAKKFDKSKDPTPFTTRAGTPYYIAPEILNAKRYDEKCDIWSCGVILYIMLTGAPPFAGNTDDEILTAVKKGKIDFSAEEIRGASKDAKDLIATCCEKQVPKRLNAQEALAHPYIKGARSRVNKPTQISSASVVSKLKNFTNADRFKKAAIHIIAHHIDDGQLNKLGETFKAMDTNGDGELSIEEVKAGCKDSGLANIDQISALFAELDTDGSGSIGYNEFLAAMMDHQVVSQRESCWEAFRVFDENGDGNISFAEFKEIMKDYDSASSDPSELEKMFQAADTDANGFVDFEEFVTMMRKK